MYIVQHVSIVYLQKYKLGYLEYCEFIWEVGY